MAQGVPFKGGNTVYCPVEQRVSLHGSTIAQRMPDRSWRFTLAGWNTPTTRSRLNAIAYFCRHAGVWNKKGQPFTGSSAAPVPVGDRDWF